MSHRLFAAAWVRALAIFLASLAPLFAVCAYAEAAPLPATALKYGIGKIVPIPASIPHEEGDMVDQRILPDLRWLAKRYPILVTDGYSGPLPTGEHAGCDGCHVRGSDHYNGLAVDIVPLTGSDTCDAAWAPITRLALWAEPTANHPQPPFRWVGYDGDAGHGCGHHLHLSWNHAPAPQFTLASWVEVFPVSFSGVRPSARGKQKPSPAPAPQAPPGPSGGISQVTYGGVSARGIGD
ncbi:MAG TPA: hypothetical protein VN732_02205 [Solirubrobacterales bacterium]|nr:hypothetical protein [Solirubrobacterales bacterium]